MKDKMPLTDFEKQLTWSLFLRVLPSLILFCVVGGMWLFTAGGWRIVRGVLGL